MRGAVYMVFYFGITGARVILSKERQVVATSSE